MARKNSGTRGISSLCDAMTGWRWTWRGGDGVQMAPAVTQRATLRGLGGRRGNKAMDALMGEIRSLIGENSFLVLLSLTSDSV